MEIINTNNNTPIFSWCPTVEDGTKDQIIKLASYPFVRKAALMPDAHIGVTMPIGGVIGCKDVVVPNCVGVDIGCGMCAMRTNLKREEVESQGKFIHNSISRGIPVGFSHNNDQRCNELVDVYSSEVTLLFQNILNNEQKRYDTLEPILNAEYNIYECLGTLGGGNHFIEIQYDEENNVWAMVHSGSRNIGKQICDCFNEIAVKNCKSWYSHGNGEVGFLPVDSQVGQDFIHWMTFAMGFASSESCGDDGRDFQKFETYFSSYRSYDKNSSRRDAEHHSRWKGVWGRWSGFAKRQDCAARKRFHKHSPQLHLSGAYRQRDPMDTPQGGYTGRERRAWRDSRLYGHPFVYRAWNGQ